MPALTHPALSNLTHRKLISSLAVMLALLGGSFGLAKTASAAPPAHPAVAAAVVTSHERVAPAGPVVRVEGSALREHFAELEVDSGEVRNPLETRNLATARPQPRSAVGGGRADHQPPEA